MRGRDDSHVDVNRSLSADAHHFGILDDAQQTHLRGRSELAHLVEEQRAAIGLLEPALAAADGAGEGALFVSEELRVDELGGDRAAVHAAERAVPERRVLVYRAGDDLLARSCFPEEQDRRAAPRHDARAGHDRSQPRVPADQPFFACARVAVDEDVCGNTCRGQCAGLAFSVT